MVFFPRSEPGRVLQQQPGHQPRDAMPCLVRQSLPLGCRNCFVGFRQPEHVELDWFGVIWAHDHLPDSDRKTTSLRSNQDPANQAPSPPESRTGPKGRPYPPRDRTGRAYRRRSSGRTSIAALQAAIPVNHQAADIALHKHRLSQGRYRCPPHGQPTDASHKATRARRYCGCWGCRLYNGQRPHSARDGRTPAVVYWLRNKRNNPVSRCKE